MALLAVFNSKKEGRCAPSFVVLVSFFGRCITVGVAVFRNRSFGTSHCVSAIHIVTLDNVQPKCYHVLSPVRFVALTQALSICTPKSKSEIFDLNLLETSASDSE